MNKIIIAAIINPITFSFLKDKILVIIVKNKRNQVSKYLINFQMETFYYAYIDFYILSELHLLISY